MSGGGSQSPLILMRSNASTPTNAYTKFVNKAAILNNCESCIYQQL
jgi:hypothetical protein